MDRTRDGFVIVPQRDSGGGPQRAPCPVRALTTRVSQWNRASAPKTCWDFHRICSSMVDHNGKFVSALVYRDRSR
jgi:hypothetical protein